MQRADAKDGAMGCGRARTLLLDHLYGSLEEADEEAVRRHLADCVSCAVSLREAEGERLLLAEAARVDLPGLRFRPPPVPLWRREFRLRSMLPAGWSPLRVALAASLLLVLGFAGARRMERASALEEFPVVEVAGPRTLAAGESTAYAVAVATVDGDPVSATVVAAASVEGMGTVAEVQAETDASGRAVLRFPGSPGRPGDPVRLAFEVRPAGGEGRRFRTFAVRDGRRLVARVATDRPLYRPGDRVRVRAVALERSRLEPAGAVPLRFRLLDARGATIAEGTEVPRDGVAAWEADLKGSAPGGEYGVVLEGPDGAFAPVERRFLVREYRIPRIRGDLDLDRDSYGPGDPGVLRARVLRLEGGVAAGASVDAVLSVDGKEALRRTLEVPPSGLLSVPFTLPTEVEEGRALLTLAVRDGGAVETLSKTVPVATGRLDVELYPEGGDLVAGLPGRVYFRVRDPAGRPADLRADLVDGEGRAVARLEVDSLGMGRFDLVPVEGAAYTLVPVSPGTARLRCEVPAVRPAGASLRTLEEVVPAGGAIALEVASTAGGEHRVVAWCRGALVGEARVALAPGARERVLLRPVQALGGVFRVTLLDPAGLPVAERLLAAAPPRRIDLAIDVAPRTAAPGERVQVAVEARDESGNPVTAVLGASVVDEGNFEASGLPEGAGMPLHFLLGLEVDELEEAEVYAGGAGAARATDLLLGVQGWRRFGWRDPAALASLRPADGPRVEPVSRATGSPLVLDNRSEAARQVAGRVRDFDRQALYVLVVVAGLAVLLGGVVLAIRLIGVLRGPEQWIPIGAASVAITVVAWVLIHGQDDRPAHATAPRAAFAARGAEGDPDYVPPEAQINIANLGTGAGVPFDPARGLVDRLLPEAEGGAGVEVREVPIAGVVNRADEEFRVFDERTRRPMGRVREYAHQRAAREAGTRKDFAELLLWQPFLVTARDGKARFHFDTSDSVTTFRVSVEAHDGTGRLGSAARALRNRVPFFLEPKVPAILSAGDVLDLPVVVGNDAGEGAAVRLRVETGSPLLSLDEGGERALDVAPGARGRALVRVVAGAGLGDASLVLSGRDGSGRTDRTSRALRVVPRGYPLAIDRAGLLEGSVEFPVLLPEEMEPGSLTGSLRLYPSVLATTTDGLESLLGIPHGCFEQVSATNYPNVLALDLMRETGSGSPDGARRARSLLEDGYRKLAAYECRSRGYEWWGKDPGHEVLTAYGLLQFTDMARSMPVDAGMLARTREWLLSRRDGKGGFGKRGGAYDEFSRTPPEVGDAYILWALTESDPRLDLGPELSRLEEVARSSEDPYLVALAARALGNRGAPAAADLRRRLALMQGEDGGLRGTSTSVTGSRGANLDVETTALAALAFLKEPSSTAHADAAVRFLATRRIGGGRFGSTQATVLALRALAEHARSARRTSTPHDIEVSVNGSVVARRHLEAGEPGAVLFGGEVLRALRPGANRVAVRTTGAEVLPWALSLGGSSRIPASDPACAVELATALPEGTVPEGEAVALPVEVRNRTGEAVPMTVARVGLPAGLEPRVERLRDLERSGAVDAWETGPREVTLYFRGLRAGETRSLTLEAVASFPGTFEGPASSAYLYYADDVRSWAAPLRVRVPAR